jgi:excisionase family DNA binding protein
MRNDTPAVAQVDNYDASSERLALPAVDVAKLLGISKRHVSALNATGRIPRPVRLGRAVRWRAHEIRDWLAAGAPSRERWESMRKEPSQ